MLYVGIDLQKKTIALCVVNQQRQVVKRQTLHCSQPERIRTFFAELGRLPAAFSKPDAAIFGQRHSADCSSKINEN
jgi:hypothetical protein